jgi:hypothetical protein
MEIQEIEDLINREKFDKVAIRYLAKAHAYAENYPKEAMVYATIGNAFATIEASRASWAKV